MIQKLKRGVEKAKNPTFDETKVLSRPTPDRSPSQLSGRNRRSKDAVVRRSLSNLSRDREIELPRDPEMNAHQKIVREIENYSQNRDYYDKFYSDYFRQVRRL